MLSSFKAFCSWYFSALALSMFGAATSPGRDRKFTLHFILTDYTHPLLASNFLVKPLSTFLEFLFWRIASVSIMFTAIHFWKTFEWECEELLFLPRMMFICFRWWGSAPYLLQSHLCSCYLFPAVHLATTHIAGTVFCPVHLPFLLLCSICNYFHYFPCWRILRLYSLKCVRFFQRHVSLFPVHWEKDVMRTQYDKWQLVTYFSCKFRSRDPFRDA